MHVTAIALVPLSLIFVLMMLTLLHMDYNGVRATLGQPIPAILLSPSSLPASCTCTSA